MRWLFSKCNDCAARLVPSPFKLECKVVRADKSEYVIGLDDAMYPTNSNHKIEDIMEHANEGMKSLALSSEHVNNRRQTTNNLFWVMNFAIFGCIGYMANSLISSYASRCHVLTILLAITIFARLGMLLCEKWTKILDQYHISSWTVVQVKRELEKPLGAKPFTGHFGLCEANGFTGIGNEEIELSTIIKDVHVTVASLACILLLITLVGKPNFWHELRDRVNTASFVNSNR